MLQKAIELAQLGFRVFPVCANSKIPAINDFPKLATTDENQLRKWWIDPVMGLERDLNIGISTDDLCVVDIDVKEGKRGDESIAQLEMMDFIFPPTFTQITPTGGKHLVYKTTTPVPNTSQKIGKGIDTRGLGGYIVGAGSVLDGKEYTIYGDKNKKIAEAQSWLIKKIGEAKEQTSAEKKEVSTPKNIDVDRANARAGEWLRISAPLAVEGEAGDHTTYTVICRLKDFGVSKQDCAILLESFWNDRCSPPWEAHELDVKIGNAYQYGNSEIGSKAIENEFAEEIEEAKTQINREGQSGDHPFDKINKEYAFVTTGGAHCIIHETLDEKKQFKLDRLVENTFHKKLASQTMMMGNKVQPVTRLWMNSPRRRSYNGICFLPGKTAGAGMYNLWKGFAYEPLAENEAPTTESKASLDAFLSHALENVCDNDPKLFHWLIGYFAHMIQKPFEKPLVALVFRGAKGVGKNALVERVGALLGPHFRVASDRRYLVGNFNAHFENNIFFALDEAFWSGDKQAEGILKSLITGTHHFIERKGSEAYTVANLTRVAIIGNEEWLVPATQAERRFAVFDVGTGKMQNNKFFEDMRVGMENGGYRVLLSYLLKYDISKYTPNIAPQTKGLHDQKIASLEPFQDWLFDCLKQGEFIGAETGWPERIPKDTLRASLMYHERKRNIRNRGVSDAIFGKLLHIWLPSAKNVRSGRDGERKYSYALPTLAQARKDWDDKMGHPYDWDND